MMTVTSVKPETSELRWAARLRDWDGHAIIGVDNAIARGVSLAELELTPEVLREARIRYAQYAFAIYLFDGSARHMLRVLTYIHYGVLYPTDISERSEDHEVLENLMRQYPWATPDERLTEMMTTIHRVTENS